MGTLNCTDITMLPNIFPNQPKYCILLHGPIHHILLLVCHCTERLMSLVETTSPIYQGLDQLQKHPKNIPQIYFSKPMTINTDLESIVNEPGHGFLRHLAPSIQRYPHRGRGQFLIDFETEQQRYRADTTGHVSEWFLLEGVDNQTFANEFLEPIDQNTPWTSWTSYDAHFQLLLVKMTKSLAHQTASMAFDHILLEAIESTGMKRSLKTIGGATHFAALGAKEPDQAWRPHRLPQERKRDWPSVVLEVACSESQQKLGSDVRFWMRASGGDVKIVLTLRVDRRQPRITVERWERNDNNDRHYLGQSITIYKGANNHLRLSNGPLIIDFEKLFLRPPTIPRERNIEVDEEKLQHLAEEIWDEQGF